MYKLPFPHAYLHTHTCISSWSFIPLCAMTSLWHMLFQWSGVALVQNHAKEHASNGVQQKDGSVVTTLDWLTK